VKRLTSAALRSATLLLTLGVVMIIPELVLAALIPLIPVVVPGIVRVAIEEVKFEPPRFVGEKFSVRIRLKLYGFGVVKVYHELDERVEVTEGKNYLVTLVVGYRLVELSYSGKAKKIGFYNLKRLLVVVENFSLSLESRKTINVGIEFEVKSRIYRRKMREIRSVAKSPLVDVDRARVGAPGTDFKEIRDYTPSDPVKFINWKATARTGSVMVNEYEKEGKKTVWIVLDANEYMIGEYFNKALELCSFLVSYYGLKGNKIGLYVLGKSLTVYPDFGKRQVKKIFDLLATLEASGHENLEEAREKMKKMLYLYEPVIFVITRAEYSKPKNFVRKVPNFECVVFSVTKRGNTLGDITVDVVRRRSLKGIARKVLFDVEESVEKLVGVVG